MKFEESSVIITGANRSIGLSAARIFAQRTKHPLVLIARDKEKLAAAEKLCRRDGAENVRTVSVDLRDAAAVSRIDFSAMNPGILINNAGQFLFKPLENTSPDEFTEQFRTNVLTAFNITGAVLPLLKKQERALIVNICSKDALAGNGQSGAYSMSKHALLGYTRSLRQELLSSNIAVTALNLGQTFSDSWAGVDINPDRLANPADVGELLVALSALSPRSVAEEIMLMPAGGPVS